MLWDGKISAMALNGSDRKREEKHEWPVHFPRNCPKERAQPVNQRVYRFADGSEDDWLSFLELGRTDLRDCRGASLSCFLSREAAEETRAMSGRWRSAKIVEADLRPEHGRIAQTGKDPSHHSLWLTRQALANAAALFKAPPCD